MKTTIFSILFAGFGIVSFQLSAQSGGPDAPVKTKAKHLYLDVHQLEPGKVKFEDVAAAHKKDLAVQKKYGAHFLKFWVNEEKGLVYCLSSAPDSESVRKTHADAHGLMPEIIYEVTDAGAYATPVDNMDYFLDLHELGPGKVTAKDVAGAHKKDLAIESKYKVNLINYFVDEKRGVVMCLAQAPDANALVQTHKEANGLIPVQVLKVQQGK
jgi:hypothetical protein